MTHFITMERCVEQDNLCFQSKLSLFFGEEIRNDGGCNIEGAAAFLYGIDKWDEILEE